MAYEITVRVIGHQDATSSGRLDMDRKAAEALFAQDVEATDPSCIVELWDTDADVLIASAQGEG